MAVQAYMSINGAKQGNITSGVNTADSMGNKYQQDHTDELTVIGFEHNIMIPRDPQSGQPTGQRVHKPLVFTKRYDKSSPLLYQALCSGERLTKIEIKWYRTTMEGTMEHYFTHKLEDALVIDIQAMMELTTNVKLDYRDHEEKISVTYRKIEWEHVVAGTMGSDDWRAPKT
jgi:type VI secretion system secreted protein Hcp